MSSEVQDYPATWRKTEATPVYLYLQIPGTVSSNTQNQRDLVAADVSSFSIGAYWEDSSQTEIVAAANLTPVSDYVFTKRTGDTGPSTGWNIEFEAPSTFFPHATDSTTGAGRNVIVQAVVTLTGGDTRTARFIGPVLAKAG